MKLFSTLLAVLAAKAKAVVAEYRKLLAEAKATEQRILANAETETKKVLAEARAEESKLLAEARQVIATALSKERCLVLVVEVEVKHLYGDVAAQLKRL